MYYTPRRREWSTPEGLIRMALAERFYGMHSFDKARAMLIAALADPDPRMRDMLRRSKITVALCAEGAKTGTIADRFRGDKSLTTNYRMCARCDRGAENMAACSGCRKVWYCDAMEQKTHWPEHKEKCKK